MAEAREMEILHAQIEELRERLENLGIVGNPRGQSKDVSLVAGIREWTGEGKGKPVHEFLTQIESLGKVSGWTSQDKALIVKAKLQGLALQFLHGHEELCKDECSYEELKRALTARFSDKLPDQFYYTKLQEATQGKEEGAEEFSDRCRKLCQRTIRKVQDEETQRIINEEAERRLLAAYIHGLNGVVGQQVQFQMPCTMEQAVRLAVTIENVERLRQMKEGPRKIFTTRQEIKCYHCQGMGHYARDCQRNPSSSSLGGRFGNSTYHRQMSRTERGAPENRGKRDKEISTKQGSRRQGQPWVPLSNRQPSGIQCFNCREFGHVRRDCTKVNRAFRHPNEQDPPHRISKLRDIRPVANE
jgi:hypothetical protein